MTRLRNTSDLRQVRRRDVLLASSLLLAPTRAFAVDTCQAVGRYSGPIVSKWLRDGRKMQLVQPVTYTARCGKKWVVPAGAINDGASIPAFLWRLVGSPLTGPYRDAAVIHDYYCAVRVEASNDVHQMFYEAMLASGVSTLKAAQLYYGVKLGGPSWDDLTIANMRLAVFGNNNAQAVTPGRTYGVRPGKSLGPAATLSSARLTVARDAAAEQEFRRFSATLTSAPVDLAALDASASAASIGVERQALASAYSPLLDVQKALDPQATVPLQANAAPMASPDGRPIS